MIAKFASISVSPIAVQKSRGKQNNSYLKEFFE